MSIRNLLVPALFFVIVAGSVIVASGQSWNKLGWVKIDQKADHATIFTGYENKEVFFTRLKLSIGDATSLQIVHMIITYGNGDKHQVDIRDLVVAGGETRVIELKGRRGVDHVDLQYDPASLGGKKLTVTAWALPSR